MTVETARAFICFEIGQNTRDYLANLIAEGKKAGDRIAWAKPHGIHLTLKFLDNITLQQIEDIETILKEISIEKSEFRITIDRIGAFPNFHTPRVFWVGNNHNSNAIANLVADLEEKLQNLGFQKERRAFKPHLTLGRVKGRDCRATVSFLRNYTFEPQTIDCNEIILMKSNLQPMGAVYTPMQKFTLQLI